MIKVKEFQSTRPGWAATGGCCVVLLVFVLFQSTRPGWAATFILGRKLLAGGSFNPRGPGGPRQKGNLMNARPKKVSIHAARVGRDGGLNERQIS